MLDLLLHYWKRHLPKTHFIKAFLDCILCLNKLMNELNWLHGWTDIVYSFIAFVLASVCKARRRFYYYLHISPSKSILSLFLLAILKIKYIVDLYLKKHATFVNKLLGSATWRIFVEERCFPNECKAIAHNISWRRIDFSESVQFNHQFRQYASSDVFSQILIEIMDRNRPSRKESRTR